MSLSLTKDDMSSKVDVVSRQLKLIEENNRKVMAENEKIKEQISQLITIVKDQKNENASLKKSITEMKREYDIGKMDDKIIGNYRANVIKNWSNDLGQYGE